MFITFEGPEGGGKSTQARRLAAALRATGFAVTLVYEPGSTKLGEAIRRLVLTPGESGALSPRAEALLFATARAQLVEEVIRPALARGDIVICDRFSDSTFAYQIGGRGLPAEAVAAVVDFATAGLRPDLTFLLDLEVSTGLARKAGGAGDRLEAEAIRFHQAVRESYRSLAMQEPERIKTIDATRPPEEIAAEIWRAVIAYPGRSGRTRLDSGSLSALNCDHSEGESAR